MATVKLPYTKIVKGHIYFHIQSRGKSSYARLPDATSPDFAAAYQKQVALQAANRTADKEAPKKGTFSALIREYRDSAKYSELKPNSRSDTDIYLNLIERSLGEKQVDKMTHRMIDRLQDAMKDTPGKANKVISRISTLLALGIRRGYCDKNVAAGTDRLKGGSHDPWPVDVIEAVLAVAKPHYALAIVSGLCSGQRVSDCVRMTHSMISSDMMSLRQKKTGKDVFIPMHPMWTQAIEALPKHDTILYDRIGRAYTTEGVQAFIRRLMKDLGYVDAKGQALYTFHGLRKNSANLLAEISASPHEISAITGMSLPMVIHYTRAVQVKLVAERIADRFRQTTMPGQVTSANGAGNASSADA